MANIAVITVAQLRAILHYDPVTGNFTRLIKNNHDRKAGNIGDIIGTKKSSGYLFADVLGCRYRVHRLAWLYMTGIFPDGQIDHINGIRSDNRWINLRLADNQQNQANSKRKKNNTSGYKGVFWSSQLQKWAAKINPDRKQVHLGYFDDPTEAHAAYANAAKRFFGQFARIA